MNFGKLAEPRKPDIFRQSSFKVDREHPGTISHLTGGTLDGNWKSCN